MAISEKKQKILIIVLVVIILLIAAILYFGLFGGVSIPAPTISPRTLLPSPAEIQPAISIEKQIELIKLDSRVLDSSLFKSFKVYGEIPIKIENVGRDNPFVPF